MEICDRPLLGTKRTFDEVVRSEKYHHRKPVDFLDHFAGALFLAQAFRLYKQEAREVCLFLD
jgi:hypothetical protein